MIDIDELKRVFVNYNLYSGFYTRFKTKNSCILVGRNKSLIGDSRNGPLIDHFENIIRINTGPIENWETFSGSKQGLIFSWFDIPDTPHFKYTVDAFNRYLLMDALGGAYPTTGLIAILLSCVIFKQVYIIGFNINADISDGELNYFESCKTEKVTNHNFKKENELLRYVSGHFPLVSLDESSDYKERIINEICIDNPS